MPKILALAAVGLLASGSALAAPDDGRARIRQQPAFSAVEIDVLDKAPLGTPDAQVYASLWEKVATTCGNVGGRLTEYHDGYKRAFFDTREGAVRMHAYATCRTDDAGPEADTAPTEFAPPVEAFLVQGTGLSPADAFVTARGDLHRAYTAVLRKAYDTCFAHDRRVRFLSLSYGKPRNAQYTVEARFGCNDGIAASFHGG